MFEDARNSKQQGDVGVAIAIATLASKGYTVLFPLSDNEPYDLAFDDGDALKKVQVRTTSRISRNKHGGAVVQLCVRGGNRSFSTTKYFDKAKVDFLFILTATGAKYLIPSADIAAKAELTLSPERDRYKI